MITVARRPLVNALNLAARVASPRSTIPVLSTVKVTANGSLSIEATDLDTTILLRLPYEGQHAQFILPDPARLGKVITNGGGDAVTLLDDVDTKRVAVTTTGGLSASIRNDCHVDDHPGARSVASPEFTASLGSDALAQLARVIPAISSEETRYYLNGVCVEHVADWTWRFVATDGHRLHIVEVPLPDFTGAMPARSILPRHFVNHVLANFARAKEGCTISYGLTLPSNLPPADLAEATPGYARVECSGPTADGSLSISSKLIDGKYPDYTRVIPSGGGVLARFARRDMIRIINTLSPFGESGKRGIRALKLTFTAEGIIVSIASPVLGDASLELPAQHGCPPGTVVGVNGRYLQQTLNVLHGDEVVITFDAGEGSHSMPMVIVDPADTAFKAILMPMRV